MPRTKTVPVVDTVGLEADEDSAKILADVQAAGLQVSGLTELSEDGSKVGADIMVTVYHAFNGREWTGPLYMTTGEGGAMSLLKYRFTPEQVRLNGLDPKWVGKRVWYAEPQPTEGPEGQILCRFSVEMPKEQKDLLRASGFDAFCRKGVYFATEAQEDYHVQKRHPRWYEFMKVKKAEQAATRTAQSQSAQTEALIALVERLTGKEEK